jgi:ssDNA-binding Zn-finger/Zn-ribbon topoisomerase 1
MANVICERCGEQGKPKRHTKGSMVIEIILWLCFLLPGLIYTAWRLNSRRDVCRACGSEDVLPINSPKGKKLAEEMGGVAPDPAFAAGQKLARAFVKAKE